MLGVGCDIQPQDIKDYYGGYIMHLLPFQTDFDITMLCMYNCKHCNVDAGSRMNDEMNTDQIKSVLDQLDEIGVSDLSITGGEPLLRKDVFEILSYAGDKKGFKLTLNTNGLLLNESVIKFLEIKCPQILIAVSLDGYNPETYSILRRNANDPKRILKPEFEQIISNLSMLVKSSLQIGVNYTVTQSTVENIFKTYDLIQQIGIKQMLAIKFFPYGAGRRNIAELELPYRLWKKFIVAATEKKKNDEYYHGMQISTTCPWEVYLPLLSERYDREFIEEIWDYCTPLKSEFYRKYRSLGCHAGITSCAISPNGDIYPCGTISTKFPPFICGNLKESSLQEIWNNSSVLKSLREIDISQMKGHCLNCHLKEICGGGCRARAFTEYNDLTAPDYLCPLQNSFMKGEEYENVCY